MQGVAFERTVLMSTREVGADRSWLWLRGVTLEFHIIGNMASTGHDLTRPMSRHGQQIPSFELALALAWLVGELVNWRVGGWVGGWVGWLGWLAVWLAGWLVGWFTVQVAILRHPSRRLVASAGMAPFCSAKTWWLPHGHKGGSFFYARRIPGTPNKRFVSKEAFLIGMSTSCSDYSGKIFGFVPQKYPVTVDGRNPAPPKNPWNDDSLVNTNELRFSMVSKWCRILCIHSITMLVPTVRVRWVLLMSIWPICSIQASGFPETVQMSGTQAKER